MRKPFTALLAFAAMLSAAAAVHANDGAFELAVGGLVLKQNDDIDMVSEDLFISTEQVRVRYVFRNRTSRDVRIIVGFPLPDRNLAEYYEQDYGWPTEFATRVDGQPVTMQVERRATRNGVDHSALLNRLGVPILDLRGGTEERLAALPREELDRLVALDLVESHDPPNQPRWLSPRWTASETWYWEQVFPAGRDLVVEHSYRPVLGGSVVAQLADPEHWTSEASAGAIARFCVDSDFLAAVERGARRAGHASAFDELRVSYILRTGAAWRSPIADFRLVVDKGSPRNLVSFCGEGLRRIGPTQFEMRRRNWRPTSDIDILVMRPLSGEE